MTKRVNTQRVELELCNNDLQKLEHLAEKKGCTVESLIESFCIKEILSFTTNSGVHQQEETL